MILCEGVIYIIYNNEYICVCELCGEYVYINSDVMVM